MIKTTADKSQSLFRFSESALQYGSLVVRENGAMAELTIYAMVLPPPPRKQHRSGQFVVLVSQLLFALAES